jgi:hypothetical protein
MEDSTFPNGYGMEQFDFLFEDFDIDQSISSESDNTPKQQNNFSSSPPIETSDCREISRPAKQLKTNSWNSSSTTSSNSMIISFDSKVVKPKHESDENMIFQSSFANRNNNQYCTATNNDGQQTKKRVATSRTPLHALDHVIAERKRREKLSQRFIALSAVIPGLKKTDKASVLEDAMKYLKELQDRVKTLEEQQSTNKMVQSSAVLVKKSHASSDYSSDDETTTFDSESITEKALPEIEARVQDRDVLIRIQCENRKGCTAKLLDEIEKLHLTVTNTSVLPFGSFILDITVVAKMDKDFSMTVKDLVRNLSEDTEARRVIR